MSVMVSMFFATILLYCIGKNTVQANGRRLVKSGFQDQRVQKLNFDFPTGFDWTPDGRLVILQKKGIVWVYEEIENTSKRIKSVDLTDVMCDNSERGLAGVAIHPDFETNNYIYLYYTFNKHDNCLEDPSIGPINRISRFILDDSSKINLSTEKVLLETPPLEYDHHNSGDLIFGKDGYLYATIGDGGSHQTFVSQDDSNLFGTIVRITDDGNIPEGNPYTFENGVQDSSRCLEGRAKPGFAKCQEIFASGLRNPFRFAMDPNTPDNKVRFFVNDVGQAAWEEISEGGDDFVGANYGWPYREGPCKNNKKNNCAPDDRFVDPIHFYLHKGSSCITAGSFVPDGVWPVEYDGAYLYAEYVKDKIWITTEGGNGCPSCNPPKSGKTVTELTEFPRIVSMKFGPYENTQALYYTSAANGGELHRIRYIGRGNYSPNASIRVSRTSAMSGETITFDGSTSSDPDGDSLIFSWEINESKTIQVNTANFSYAFTNPGLYWVTLNVNDGRGGEDTSAIEISIGHKPIPVIESIPIDATFSVGDIIVLRGSATDEEDGILRDTSLSWEVRQHHDTHFHPFLEKTIGNNIKLQSAPAPEDYDAATNSFLEVLLTATDSDGLSTTISRVIHPKKVLVRIEAIPSGLELILDGLRISTPITVTSWENHSLQVIAPFQFLGDIPYHWKSWSDGKEKKHNIIIPPSASEMPKYVATFGVYTGIDTPSVAPTAEPPRVIGLLEGKREYLLSGEPKVLPEHGLTLTQQTNGNLVLARGSDLIWETGVKSSPGKYYTYINGISRMMTKRGTPSKSGGNVWVTQTDHSEGDYFLGLKPDYTVSIYGGKPNNPGIEIWNSIGGVIEAVEQTIFPIAPPATKYPTATTAIFSPSIPSGASKEVIYLLMTKRTKIYNGMEVNSTPYGYTFRQYSNGRVAVFEGDYMVWDRDGIYAYKEGAWFSSLQGDCNFLVKQEVKYNYWPTRWKTATSSDQDCFLGIFEEGEGVMSVGVIEGDPNNPGDLLWSNPLKVEPTFSPTLSSLPTLSPSLPPSAKPTSSPTTVPSLSPTLTPSSLPTNVPSLPPTISTSVLPSVEASLSPTTNPSLLPSKKHSVPPSTYHSATPTTFKSTSSTKLPTLSPTPSLSDFLESTLSSPSPTVNPVPVTNNILPSTPMPPPSLLPTTSKPTTIGVGSPKPTNNPNMASPVTDSNHGVHTSENHNEYGGAAVATPNLEWQPSDNIFETTDENESENSNIPDGLIFEVSRGHQNSICYCYGCLFGFIEVIFLVL